MLISLTCDCGLCGYFSYCDIKESGSTEVDGPNHRARARAIEGMLFLIA